MKKSDITRMRLNSAIERIVRGEPEIIKVSRKISMSAVAEEAGVHPSTIHTRYPEIADKIRVLAGIRIDGKVVVDMQDGKAEDLQRQLSEKAIELDCLKLKLIGVISENASLILKNHMLEMQMKVAKIGYLE